MIKIYHIPVTHTELKTKFTVSIDTGINTGGLCFINHETKQINILPYGSSYNAMEAEFPKLYVYINDATKKYVSIIEEGLKSVGHTLSESEFNQTEITMEYTGTWGIYSIGLFAFLSGIVTKLVNTFKIKGITFIPPITGKYFLMGEYKKSLKDDNSDKSLINIKDVVNLKNITVSKTAVKKLVEIHFKDILPKVQLKGSKKDKEPKFKLSYTSHQADSLILSVYQYYGFFKELFPSMDLVKPDYEMVKLELSELLKDSFKIIED